MSSPLVTICIPTFNGEQFIDQAMESAINQSYRPLDIVVSDDCSLDRTLEVVEIFRPRTDINIMVVKHQPKGIGANWNNCVLNAEGKYIKFLFQDDILKPECIQRMVDCAEKDPAIGLVFSKRDLIVEGDDEKYEKWISQFGDLQQGWRKINEIQSGKSLLKDPNFMVPPRNKVGEPTAVLLRKSVFDKVGFFDENLKQALDYEYWYRVFKHYKVGYIDTALVSFRLHDEQATAKNSKVHISDYDEYPRIVYRKLFWCLSFRLRKELFLKYNTVGKLINKVLVG